MADIKIYDYATGKEVKNNPEEAYRQLFEHILIDDLGYPKSHIDIEVVLQRGSNRNAEEVDIPLSLCPYYITLYFRPVILVVLVSIEGQRKNEPKWLVFPIGWRPSIVLKRGHHTCYKYVIKE